MIHHSHVVCDDCGERHTPGNKEECIEQLQETIADIEVECGRLRAGWELVVELARALECRRIANGSETCEMTRHRRKSWCLPCRARALVDGATPDGLEPDQGGG